MALTSLEINTRQPLADRRAFGDVGPYLQLDGTARFAVDPNHPLNQGINDLALAPPDGDGLVHFSADFRILAPEDPRRGNRRLLFDVQPREPLGAADAQSRAAPDGPQRPARHWRRVSDAPRLYAHMVRLAA